MSKQEKSAEAIVAEDSSLMEFLSTTGSVLFNISKEEWSTYLDAGESTVEFDNISIKKEKVMISSSEKLQKDIKIKEKYIRELKKKKKENELKIEEFNHRILLNEQKKGFVVDKSKNNKQADILLEIKDAKRFLVETENMIKRHKKEFEDLSKEMSMLERRKIQIHSQRELDEPENTNIEIIRINRIRDIIRKKIEMIQNKLMKKTHTRDSILSDLSRFENEKKESRRLKSSISKLDQQNKSLVENKKKIEIDIESNIRKIKRAQTTLNKLKEKLKKIQSVRL